MSTESPDLALAERTRIITEARALVDRIAEYTALINAWAQEETDAEQ